MSKRTCFLMVLVMTLSGSVTGSLGRTSGPAAPQLAPERALHVIGSTADEPAEAEWVVEKTDPETDDQLSWQCREALDAHRPAGAARLPARLDRCLSLLAMDRGLHSRGPPRS